MIRSTTLPALTPISEAQAIFTIGHCFRVLVSGADEPTIKGVTKTDLTDEDFKLFGALVLNLRVTKCLSVDEFAQRAGLSAESVEKIEDGRSEYDLEELFAISRGLEMPVSAIFRIWEDRNLVDPGRMVH